MPFMRFITATLVAIGLPVTALANDVCTFTGNAYDFKRLGEAINGVWSMTGTGVGFTMGVTNPTLEISTNATGTQMYVGSDGRKFELKPLARARISEVSETRPSIVNSALRYNAVGGDGVVETNVADLALTVGCPTESAPIVYWYNPANSGSSGVYIFLSDGYGVGFISNGARGKRSVLLYR